MDVIEPAERTYAWGSRVALPQLAGEDTPAPYPIAERWFGAHPTAPATIVGESLEAIIAADPQRALGVQIADAYDDTLPFMVKLLAAEQPLSLQAHPSRELATEGFYRENDAGLAIDAPNRNFRDPHHKPELIVALSPFEALAGFRPPQQTVRLFDAMDIAALRPYRDVLAEQPDADGLRTVFTTFITLPRQAAVDMITAVVDSLVALLATGTLPADLNAVARNVVHIAEQYPHDTGVLGTLLLNHVHLEPGEGLYMGEGKLHAYLSGMGIEVMANSDNVLRGGLTSKHIDVPELLRVLDFDPVARPKVEAVSAASPRGEPLEALLVEAYPTPATEFHLTRVRAVADCRLRWESAGPQILVCTAGQAGPVRAGGGVWIPAEQDTGTLALTSGTELFCVRVNSHHSTKGLTI